MTVNGVPHSQEIETRLLLVHFLRETLGLTGTHVGCDTTNCGAHGARGRDAGEVLHDVRRPGGRREVTTGRGLASPAGSARCRRASTRSTGSSALLHARDDADGDRAPGREPDPSEEEIRWALSGHICRCTGYQNIVKAVQYAAAKGKGH